MFDRTRPWVAGYGIYGERWLRMGRKIHRKQFQPSGEAWRSDTFRELVFVQEYEILHFPEQDFFEGEGDLLMCGNFLFAGYPFRSSLISHRRAAEILQCEVFSLRLTSDWFYHLDTCFCPLDNKTAMYYPRAFDRKALKLLENHVDLLITVSEEEARRFACNAIVLKKNVIMNDGCPEIRRQLEALGFFVSQIPLSEFIKAGGSAKCLVLKLPHCGNQNQLAT